MIETTMTQQAEETEQQLIDMAAAAVRQSNWTIGEAASKWTERHARGRSDADFADLIGTSRESVNKARRVYDRFLVRRTNFEHFSWTQWREFLSWPDAEECLDWLEATGETLENMHVWRRVKNGEPIEPEPVKAPTQQAPEPDPPIVTPKEPATPTVKAEAKATNTGRTVNAGTASTPKLDAVPAETMNLPQAAAIAVRSLRQLAVHADAAAIKAAIEELQVLLSEWQPQPSKAVTDEQFEQWWQRYPRRKGKGQARKAFRAAAKRVGYQRLCEATEAFARDCESKQTDIQYIPHPATWLNGERWDDEPDRASSPNGKTEQTIRSLEEWLCDTAGTSAVSNTEEGTLLIG